MDMRLPSDSSRRALCPIEKFFRLPFPFLTHKRAFLPSWRPPAGCRKAVRAISADPSRISYLGRPSLPLPCFFSLSLGSSPVLERHFHPRSTYLRYTDMLPPPGLVRRTIEHLPRGMTCIQGSFRLICTDVNSARVLQMLL
jgi:hypothetical protein